MAYKRRAFAALLCFAVLLCTGCQSEPPPATTPSTDPPTVLMAAEEALALYDSAIQTVGNAPSLAVEIRYDLERRVNGQVYTESVTGTTEYSGLDTDSPLVLSEQNLSFGSFSVSYREYFQAGIGYVSANGSTFQKEMSAEKFISRQIPAQLLTADLYDTASATMTSGVIHLSFSGAAALEHWVPTVSGATFTGGSGTVVLSADGQLLHSYYQATYLCGDIPYALKVTATPTLGEQALEGCLPTPETASVTLENLDVPRLILGVVGDVYTANAITAAHTNTLYSQVHSTLRQQTSRFDVYGTGVDTIAKFTHRVEVTDYTNTPMTTDEVTTYLDGKYTTVTNGGVPQAHPGITGNDVRVTCEDAILASVMTLDALAGADITADDGLISIRLTGNEQFEQKITQWIYSIFQSDLDLWADTYSSDPPVCFLYLDMNTRLLAGTETTFSRIHTSDGVPYVLTYQFSQSVTFSDEEAYTSITG